ncbi:MAG: hypothetical protein ACRES5_34730 [Pseudomonas sp.]
MVDEATGQRITPSSIHGGSEVRVEGIFSLAKVIASGADTGTEAAKRLEFLLDELFPDDDYLQETVEMLACYHPEVGRDVLGIQSIRDRLVVVDTYLQGKSKTR